MTDKNAVVLNPNQLVASRMKQLGHQEKIHLPPLGTEGLFETSGLGFVFGFAGPSHFEAAFAAVLQKL